jgi:hypothetical protein
MIGLKKKNFHKNILKKKMAKSLVNPTLIKSIKKINNSIKKIV